MPEVKVSRLAIAELTRDEPPDNNYVATITRNSSERRLLALKRAERYLNRIDYCEPDVYDRLGIKSIIGLTLDTIRFTLMVWYAMCLFSTAVTNRACLWISQ